MNKYTLIVHFKDKHLGFERLDKIAQNLAEISGLNVLCFDNAVELKLIKVEEEQDIRQGLTDLYDDLYGRV